MRSLRKPRPVPAGVSELDDCLVDFVKKAKSVDAIKRLLQASLLAQV